VSVGDTPLSDIRPAKLVGINTIWVNRVNEPKPKELDQAPDFEVENLIQIVDIIDSLG
jgi:FMN phosphatase YigB (HAD superfamily)